MLNPNEVVFSNSNSKQIMLKTIVLVNYAEHSMNIPNFIEDLGLLLADVLWKIRFQCTMLPGSLFHKFILNLYINLHNFNAILYAMYPAYPKKDACI